MTAAATPSGNVSCGYCGRAAELVRGEDVYPAKPELAERRFWRCVPCGAWVGCHPGTSVPLGSLADARLRRARMRAHAALDALWKGQGAVMTRTEAYAWLAGALGLRPFECHVAMFDEARCGRVVEACAAKCAAPRE